MKIVHSLILTLFSLAVGTQLHASEKQLWTPLDTLLIKQFTNVQVSPDGENTFIRVLEPSAPDKDPNNVKQPINTYIVSNKTGNLTPVDEHLPVLGFDWSYDGKWLIYSTGNVEQGAIWIKPSNGGSAKKIYESSFAGAHVTISPDGQKIAISASRLQKNILDPKQSQLYGQIYLLSFQDKNFENPKVEALTPDTLNVSQMMDPMFSWSPDGRYLVFSIDNKDWRGGTNSTLALIDVKTKEIIELLSEKTALIGPIFSPDQEYIAYVKSSGLGVSENTDKKLEEDVRICTYNLKTKENRCIDRNTSNLVNLIGWTTDSKSLLYNNYDETKINIHQVSLDGTQDTILNKGLEGIVNGFSLSHNNKYLGFLYSNMTTPQEAYFTALSSFKPHQLTHIQNVPSLKSLKSEVIKWKSFDGLEIEGTFTYPTEYKKGTKTPLIVWVHGGPAGVASEEFLGDTSLGPFSPAVLASEGYAVFLPNYRGSKGYEDNFVNMSYMDFGGGDFKDILYGIDDLIKKEIVDPDRIVIGGWSYGGFLSAWAITHEQRFKAAIVGAGPIDWYTNTAVADNSVFEIRHMGRDLKDWFKMSPLMTIKNAKTPVLIQQGENDTRVPVANTFELSYALKRLKVPHKGILYKGQGHGFQYSSPGMYQAINDQVDWIKKYIKPYQEAR